MVRETDQHSADDPGAQSSEAKKQPMAPTTDSESTAEQAKPLDHMPVAPLTDPTEMKGG